MQNVVEITVGGGQFVRYLMRFFHFFWVVTMVHA